MLNVLNRSMDLLATNSTVVQVGVTYEHGTPIKKGWTISSIVEAFVLLLNSLGVMGNMNTHNLEVKHLGKLKVTHLG